MAVKKQPARPVARCEIAWTRTDSVFVRVARSIWIRTHECVAYVACEICKSKAGEACTNRWGEAVTATHAVRRKAWQKVKHRR